MKRKLLILFLGAFIGFSATAQNKLCGTNEAIDAAYQDNPSLIKNAEKLEQFTQHFIQHEYHQQKSGVKIIPIVFHVIHTYDSDNITIEQIRNAVNIINEDFRKMAADTGDVIPQFKGIHADSEIEFRLARIDPDGNCTEGVTRTFSELTNNAGENVKALVSWDTRKYLNVWVVDNIASGAGAYAYYPGSAPSSANEGIVCRNSQLGAIGASGGSNFARRTLSHEIGHYLNLPHVWGSNNNVGQASACNLDDGVSDTPNTIGTAQSCNLSQITCGSLDNIQNIMDYSTCAKMFSEGQKARMQAALNSTVGGRYYLWQQSNLVATGTNDGFVNACAPIADFHQSNTTACSGSAINFFGLAYNAPDSTIQYNWEFEGGTPTTSNLQDPSIIYLQPGKFKVKLTASTPNGVDSLVREEWVNVLDAVNAQQLPFYEGFENAEFPLDSFNVNNEWTINDPNGILMRTNQTSVSGDYSIRINNQNDGRTVEFISPLVSLTSPFTLNRELSFQVAYRSTNPDEKDILKVFVSNDCGKTFQLRYAKSGATLASTNSTAWNFVPGPNDWREDRVDLSLFNGQNVLIKFEVETGGGDPLYIDNINFGNYVISVDELVESKFNFSVYPNPFNQDFQASFYAPNAKNAKLIVRDVAGRTLANKTVAPQIGNNTVTVNELANLNAGIYFVQLTIDGITTTQRIVKQ